MSISALVKLLLQQKHVSPFFAKPSKGGNKLACTEFLPSSLLGLFIGSLARDVPTSLPNSLSLKCSESASFMVTTRPKSVATQNARRKDAVPPCSLQLNWADVLQGGQMTYGEQVASRVQFSNFHYYIQIPGRYQVLSLLSRILLFDSMRSSPVIRKIILSHHINHITSHPIDHPIQTLVCQNQLEDLNWQTSLTALMVGSVWPLVQWQSSSCPVQHPILSLQRQHESDLISHQVHDCFAIIYKGPNLQVQCTLQSKIWPRKSGQLVAGGNTIRKW